MGSMYKDSIKEIIHRDIIKRIEELNLTQEQTAEILGIDVRSLAYLKAGKTMCSATTLLMYLTKMCENPSELLEKIDVTIKRLEEN